MEMKLDAVTLRAWKQEGNVESRTLSNFVDYLQKRCLMLERLEARTKEGTGHVNDGSDKQRSKNRSQKHALTGDIRQLYRQIVVDPQDCNYQRILLRFFPDELIKARTARFVSNARRKASERTVGLLSITEIRVVYITLFICFATKAIHLEATSELSTAAFLATLRRFVDRRGCPKEI
ncbi:hypothetical protein ALC57_18397 [Trachymyrmex cornetzi]|uniref:Uncharacterized protein n=1 Tax=Trachymyrmex cornetzi TaxID=471704 RepID=A0A151IS37_9HYME|nr:hypothetical protein ALC57_18397 [Trachymyrmex cornetzi]